MTGSPRIVEGTILRLRCDACSSVFPHFLFSGEEDSDTAGLCSASSCEKDELVIAEAEPSEWNDLAHTDAAVGSKIAEQLQRNDLKVVRLLRVERETGATGLSFSDFRKAYKPPTLIYSCACCANGESRAIEEITVEAFQKAGGRIITTGRLALSEGAL
jgi:hypothetical protein